MILKDYKLLIIGFLMVGSLLTLGYLFWLEVGPSYTCNFGVRYYISQYDFGMHIKGWIGLTFISMSITSIISIKFVKQELQILEEHKT